MKHWQMFFDICSGILIVKWSFDFDHLDTIPYWYDNLGDFFDLSGMGIAVLAQNIICKEWGFTGNVSKANHVYTADGDWHLTRNDHGSIPKIETLQKKGC